MLTLLARLFRPAPALARIEEGEGRVRLYNCWRWSMFLSVTFGYGVYYVGRLGLSVAKKPLIDSGLLDAKQLGQIGFATLITYAVGKTAHGFLADRLHLQRLFATGLFATALMNIAFGLSNRFWLFLLLWGLNGWMQSMGQPTAGVVLANWFSERERGTRYSIWSISHSLGEGVTFAGTAALVAVLGWRSGFVGAGLGCAAVAFILMRTMVDRPQSLGLPPIAEHLSDERRHNQEARLSVGELQRMVLTNPLVWVLGLASALMYVARYAINNWAVLYLQIEKHYPLATAGSLVALFPMGGIIGTVTSGYISDRFFGSRRTPVTLLFGLLLIAAQYVFYFSAPGHPWIDRASLCVAGFSIGGLLVFLGGLTALDLTSSRASGAALGVIGGMSYLGAAIQDWISGALIESSRHVVAGVDTYDFSQAKLLWIGTSVVSLLLASTIWRAELRLSAAKGAP